MSRNNQLAFAIAFGLLGGTVLALILFALTGEIALTFGLAPGAGLIAGAVIGLLLPRRAEQKAD